jgi:hypothetical protein
LGKDKTNGHKIEAKPNLGFIQNAKEEFTIVKTTQSKKKPK